MLKKLVLSLAVAVVSLTLMPIDAEAGRLGSGRSIGMQRSTPAVVNKAPAMANPSATSASPMANNSATNKRSWAGPLAGLAAGLGLGMLMSHLGLGEGLGSIMQILLIAGIAFMIYKFVIAKKMGGANRSPLQYAGNSNYQSPQLKTMPSAGNLGGGSNYSSAGPQIGSNLAGGAASASSMPVGFNAESFVRAAKVNFIRLQTANDNLNLDDLREFTSPEMFAELKMDIEERGNHTQKTEISDLEAQILEVANEENRFVASVLFQGKSSENGGMAISFQEVWHMVKPADGSTGWVVAGIQV